MQSSRTGKWGCDVFFFCRSEQIFSASTALDHRAGYNFSHLDDRHRPSRSNSSTESVDPGYGGVLTDFVDTTGAAGGHNPIGAEGASSRLMRKTKLRRELEVVPHLALWTNFSTNNTVGKRTRRCEI